MNILNDRDGSGDDVLYCRDTDSMHKVVGTVYSRDPEGNLVTDDSGFMKTTGLSISFDMEKTWYPVTYSEVINEASDLGIWMTKPGFSEKIQGQCSALCFDPGNRKGCI